MATSHHPASSRTHKRKLNGSTHHTPHHFGAESADFALHELGDLWHKAEGSLKTRTSHTKQKLYQYTKQHTGIALAGAALTGAFLALLLRR